MKLSRIKNTLFFISQLHGIAVGYINLHFRKRNIVSCLSDIRREWKRARQLEAELPTISAGWGGLVWQAKGTVYRKRTDLERPLEDIIHPIQEKNQVVTAGQAWDLLMNGTGTSVFTGRNIKPIICIEKRKKVLAKCVDLMRDSIGQ